MDILKTLEERGILKDVTNRDKFNSLKNKSVYIGFDPTGESLHLGNYVQIIVLKWFQKCGFTPIAVLGGATGMVGDPSGKSQERNLLEKKQLAKNKHGIRNQFNQIGFQVVDNLSFYSNMNVLKFFREVGKLINVNYLINKEVIKSRLESGLSFTEFSYQLIQGWDFKKLYEKYNVSVQVGGSDQWGNITTGIEMIRKVFGEESEAVGITTNLLLKSDGKKFGKTETGTIWLDENLTSPFEMYQFFLNQEDADVERLLKWLTFLPIDSIDEIMQHHLADPKSRFAQKALAKSVVIDIHSQKDWEVAIKLTNLLYNDRNAIGVSAKEIKTLFDSLPKINAKKIFLVDALIELGAASSKRQARELIIGGGIRVNGNVVTDVLLVVKKNPSLFDGKVSIIKKGKRFNYLVNHTLNFKNAIAINK